MTSPPSTGCETSAAFSQDGTRVVSGSTDGTARIWDAVTGKPLRPLDGHKGGVTGVAFSPDSACVATCGLDKTVNIWDPRTGRQLRAYSIDLGAVTWMIYCPGGAQIAAGNDNGMLKTFDA